MFFAEARVRVFIYGQPVDARKSYDGLYALARNEMKQDPLSGHLFCFINRRANQVKVLWWDRSGFCIWSKKLEVGRFVSDWGQIRSSETDWTHLKLLLEGVEPKSFRKRYSRLPTA
ncbi:MAG: IS66 family insertion sequence element accessory protein TnpB [Ferrovum myxofaciens]